MKKFFLGICLSWLSSGMALPAWCESRIAILDDSLPRLDAQLVEDLANRLKSEGYEIIRITADELCDPAIITPDRVDLLLLPAAAALPAESMKPVEDFIHQGGDIIALQAPAFTEPLWKSGADWLTVSEWRGRLNQVPATHVLFDFENEKLERWTRNSNTPNSPASWELKAGYEGKALHVSIENMAGWDTMASPVLDTPFPDGHTLTCLYAKGVGKTNALSLEWLEKDGSRWIAVFPVTNEWQRIVLTPRDFKYWKSVPERGRAGDGFNPQNAVRLNVGVAWTHTGPRGGEYEYFVDQIGTAPNPFGDHLSEIQEPPRIEGFSPSYKFYPLTDVAKLQPRWIPFEGKSVPVPSLETMQAHHPRPTGKGFGKRRDWRWIPLIEALGPHGEWRGALAGLFVDNALHPGSLRAWFGIQDPAWYRRPEVQKFIVQLTNRMAEGLLLMEGGTEYFTYREGQPVIVGTQIANLLRDATQEFTVSYEISAKNHPELPLVKRDTIASAAPGGILSVSSPVSLPGKERQYQITVRLAREGIVLDQITHDFFIYKPKPEDQRRLVTVRKGDFYLDGRKWYVHGVNYLPSTGIGVDDYGFFEQWLGRRAYDPEFIQRDLERCRDMGLNSVSIFLYHRSLRDNNLLDILRRCEELGLYVNLSIRPGNPMQYDWNRWREIIEFNRLWEQDIIYAYDIAWEPFFGTIEERRAYDADWQAWIIQQYGSLEAVEKTWGVGAPRFDGKVSSPTPEQLGEDGPHRRMVADYRRFVDDLIHEKYLAAAEQIRALDPHHLVSFRMTVTGDPTFKGDLQMPYDFKGVARPMDFLAPEGYGRIGDWERVKPGIFTVAYARYCASDKPVLWAEAGVHVWNHQTMRVDPELLDYQGRFYEDFYHMVSASYSNGVVWWWYPGGYRANEQSDYGIINPDGTDRPATKAIRRNAARVLAERTIPRPDVWIEIDRDADARGLYGVYDRVKDAFWRAFDSGRFPGLR
ncbi:MAG: beta-galactosidase [bacterium]